MIKRKNKMIYASHIRYEKYIFYSCRYLVFSINVKAPVSEPLACIFINMIDIFLFLYFLIKIKLTCIDLYVW